MTRPTRMMIWALRHRVRLANVALVVLLLAMGTYVFPLAAERGQMAARVRLLGGVVDTLAIVVVDLDGNVRLFSKGAEELFSVGPSLVIGKPFYWMLDDLTKDTHIKMFKEHTFPKTRDMDIEVECLAYTWDHKPIRAQIRVQRVDDIDGHATPGYCVRIHNLDKISKLQSPHYPLVPVPLPQPTLAEKNEQLLRETQSVLRRTLERRDANKEDSDP